MLGHGCQNVLFTESLFDHVPNRMKPNPVTVLTDQILDALQ